MTMASPGFVHVIAADAAAGLVAGFIAVSLCTSEGCDVYADLLSAFVAPLPLDVGGRPGVTLYIAGSQQE